MYTLFTGLASLYTYPTKNVEQQLAVSRLIHNRRLHGLFVFCAVFCMEYGKVSGCWCRMRNFHHQWFHTAKSAGCFYFSMVLKLILSSWFWISFINVFLSIDTERKFEILFIIYVRIVVWMSSTAGKERVFLYIIQVLVPPLFIILEI